MKNLIGTKTPDMHAMPQNLEKKVITRLQAFLKKQWTIRIEHAESFLIFLSQHCHREALMLQASYPIGLGRTFENLSYAVTGDRDEWSHLYPKIRIVTTLAPHPAIDLLKKRGK